MCEYLQRLNKLPIIHSDISLIHKYIIIKPIIFNRKQIRYSDDLMFGVSVYWSNGMKGYRYAQEISHVKLLLTVDIQS